MISCQEVVNDLWDYLDGELPAARAATIADHLAECARCYPRYRFEYSFLAAVARQRSLGPGPSPALVERVAGAILAATAPVDVTAAQASRPLAERWGLAVLRVSLGAFLLVSSVGKLFAPVPQVVVSPQLWAAAAAVEAGLAAVVLLGLWRRWSYGAMLAVHLASLFIFWSALRDPLGVALAGLPTCGALITLYLLRHRDPWTLDTWLAWRRPWRVVR
jgi:hypothetical protein